MDGAPTCSRLGCDELAVAVFAFDARECLVWLDPIGAGGRGAGVLCGPHADRMSPPWGWNLLDRRGAESRLWLGRADTAAKPATVARRRERSPRTRPHDGPGPRLPLEPAGAGVRETDPPAGTPAPTRAPWSPHDRPSVDFEHVLDARTPLLARAFEAARSVVDDE